MRTARIWVLGGALAAIGCSGRVYRDEPMVEPPPPPPGGGEAGAGGEGGSMSCGGWVSECDPDADKKVQKKACDDGNPKTADRCAFVGVIGGTCAHVDVECDNFDPVPTQQMACDDGDPNTLDKCTQWNACLSHPIN